MNTKLYLLIFFVLPSYVFAVPYTLNKAVVASGNWSASGSWSLGRVPADNDSVVIPAGDVITFDNSESLNNVFLTVGGTLTFKQNNSLDLDAASIINILSTGVITAAHPTPNELISIGGNNKFVGNQDVAITGPSSATVSTGNSPTGFVGHLYTLPVVFVAVSANRVDDHAVELSWRTANEINNSHFEVERSLDGSGWTMVATINAGVNGAANSYSFSDENAPAAQAMYRVRQVDIDGNFIYSKIAIAGGVANAQATIFASGRTVSILPGSTGGRLTVRVVSIGGQVLQQQNYEGAAGRIDVTVAGAPTGIYLVQVTDGSQWSVVKKVML